MRWPGDGKADQRVSGWSPCFPGGGGPSLARSHGGPVHTEGPLQNTTLPTMDATCKSSGPSPAPTLSYWGKEKGKSVLATVKA